MTKCFINSEISKKKKKIQLHEDCNTFITAILFDWFCALDTVFHADVFLHYQKNRYVSPAVCTGPSTLREYKWINELLFPLKPWEVFWLYQGNRS